MQKFLSGLVRLEQSAPGSSVLGWCLLAATQHRPPVADPVPSVVWGICTERTTCSTPF